MSISLYEITKDFEQAIAKYQYAETDEEMQIALDEVLSLEEAKEVKLSNCCAYIKGLDAHVQAIELAIAELKKKKESTQRRQESFKEYMKHCLADGEKWTNGVHALSWRNSEYVDIRDDGEIPKEYCVEKITLVPDKKAIATDLKNGAMIPGATLGKRVNLIVK